jgi:hypothetical protein
MRTLPHRWLVSWPFSHYSTYETNGSTKRASITMKTGGERTYTQLHVHHTGQRKGEGSVGTPIAPYPGNFIDSNLKLSDYMTLWWLLASRKQAQARPQAWVRPGFENQATMGSSADAIRSPVCRAVTEGADNWVYFRSYYDAIADVTFHNRSHGECKYQDNGIRPGHPWSRFWLRT